MLLYILKIELLSTATYVEQDIRDRYAITKNFNLSNA
jgi:hypothetical protein